MGNQKDIVNATRDFRSDIINRIVISLACILFGAATYSTINSPIFASAYWGHGKSISMIAMIISFIVAGYHAAVLITNLRIRSRNGAQSETLMLASLFRAAAIIAGLGALLYVTGALPKSWAALAGFGGLLLGWSLQAPVSGIAAWALISLKRPFRIGDRVMLPAWNLTGDIFDIGMMYTKLNQVGGTVGSEDLAGRSILIPNAMLFGNIVVNYTPQQAAAFVLDEVVVRVTYNSNWDLAEKVLLRAAQEVTGDIIQRTGSQPYVRAAMYDYGVQMYLRYMTQAKDRPRIAYEITKQIVREFQKSPSLDFSMPFVFSHRTGMRMSKSKESATGDYDTKVISIDRIRSDHDAISNNDKTMDVAELREKIAHLGLLQPILVSDIGGGHYSVIAGELRLEACRQLGWSDIPCVIKSSSEPNSKMNPHLRSKPISSITVEESP